MREINNEELINVNGGRNFFTVIEGALLGGLVEGFIGFFIAGPAGMVVGFGHGVYDGAAFGVVYEGAHGLVEITHPELGPSP